LSARQEFKPKGAMPIQMDVVSAAYDYVLSFPRLFSSHFCKLLIFNLPQFWPMSRQMDVCLPDKEFFHSVHGTFRQGFTHSLLPALIFCALSLYLTN
jgi:hypothetical protein